MSASTPLAPAAEPERAAVTPAELIHRHLLGVWRYLRMHGASAHEADDLAQEAFVIALQKGATDLDPPATATFLRRTARFLFLRHRRNRRDAVELADAVDALWTQDCAHDDGDALVASLRHCVEQLQGRARAALQRCYGLDDVASTRHAAAAAELGLQPNGLKTLLQRTRQLLKACIERNQR